MSFPALFLACQAVEHMPPLEDDELDVSWSDLDVAPTLFVRWAMYRSQGAGTLFGVYEVAVQSFSDALSEWAGEVGPPWISPAGNVDGP